ncbi:unnamed protein product [Prunus armeniaca]
MGVEEIAMLSYPSMGCEDILVLLYPSLMKFDKYKSKVIKGKLPYKFPFWFLPMDENASNSLKHLHLDSFILRPSSQFFAAFYCLITLLLEYTLLSRDFISLAFDHTFIMGKEEESNINSTFFSNQQAHLFNLLSALTPNQCQQLIAAISMDLATGRTIGLGKQRGGLYYMSLLNTASLSCHVSHTSSLWHQRLGHPSPA